METDTALCLESFAAAVAVPVSTLTTDLSRAHAVLHQLGHHQHSSRLQQEQKQEQKQEQETERTWATYYVQLMKEVKTCFVFDQLSHGNERMKVSNSRT